MSSAAWPHPQFWLVQSPIMALPLLIWHLSHHNDKSQMAPHAQLPKSYHSFPTLAPVAPGAQLYWFRWLDPGYYDDTLLDGLFIQTRITPRNDFYNHGTWSRLCYGIWYTVDTLSQQWNIVAHHCMLTHYYFNLSRFFTGFLQITWPIGNLSQIQHRTIHFGIM